MKWRRVTAVLGVGGGAKPFGIGTFIVDLR
jgi:hypothetical protein